MRVLVIGGGGREHALIHAFSSSKLATRLICAPGNAGTGEEADNVPIDGEDLPQLLAFAKRERIDLTVVGPEAPLVAGISDLFAENGLLVFGPGKEASQLEGSKAFAKEIMYEAQAPTGHYRSHCDLGEALRYLDKQSEFPLVVKADGLAAGKGVTIAQNHEQARVAIKESRVARRFGDAGATVLIEEYLQGAEVSLLAICDGKTIMPLAPAQDYKRIFAGDNGPNTGGMGSYCPVPGFEIDAVERIVDEIYQPVLAALRRRGIEYRGVLYGGLIVTERGVKLLEFNCRFGDPETQAILPRLDCDLLEVCLATANGELSTVKLAVKPQPCVSVVLASKGYPASSSKGDVIHGLAKAAAQPDVTVYHAGTALKGQDVVTAGGRVLAVSALGDSFAAARERAYTAVKHIHFDGMQVRDDIAERAVKAEQGDLALFPSTWAS